MTEVFAYPDVERVLHALLQPIGPRVVTMLPPEFEPPIFWIQRAGGGADDGITDISIARVHAFGKTRTQAVDLATLATHRILEAGGRAVDVPGYGRILIDWTDLAVGATEVADLDPDDRRFSSDFAVACRRNHLTLSI